MITDLSVVSSTELARMESAITERAKELSTKEGMTEAQLWAVKLLEYLAVSGYKLPSVDKALMAKTWADQLSEAIIVYGYDDIARVVKLWVKEDCRDYKQFPTTGTILARVKELLGNPIVEIARRNHEAQVEQMVQHEHDELMNGVSEEHLKELERRYKHE